MTKSRTQTCFSSDLQARMQQGLVADQGDAFDSAFTQNSDGSEVTVTRCMYDDILAEENKPQLLRVCCCSQDGSW
jgi:hypothetical protein